MSTTYVYIYIYIYFFSVISVYYALVISIHSMTVVPLLHSSLLVFGISCHVYRDCSLDILHNLAVSLHLHLGHSGLVFLGGSVSTHYSIKMLICRPSLELTNAAESC